MQLKVEDEQWRAARGSVFVGGEIAQRDGDAAGAGHRDGGGGVEEEEGVVVVVVVEEGASRVDCGCGLTVVAGRWALFPDASCCRRSLSCDVESVGRGIASCRGSGCHE